MWKSLYTSISYRGPESPDYYLKDHTEETLPPSTFICEQAALVVKLNYFSFFGDLILQCRGKAMGSTFASECAKLCIYFYFCIFQGTINDLNHFVNLLNNMNPDLLMNMIINRYFFQICELNYARAA